MPISISHSDFKSLSSEFVTSPTWVPQPFRSQFEWVGRVHTPPRKQSGNSAFPDLFWGSKTTPHSYTYILIHTHAHALYSMMMPMDNLLHTLEQIDKGNVESPYDSYLNSILNFDNGKCGFCMGSGLCHDNFLVSYKCRGKGYHRCFECDSKGMMELKCSCNNDRENCRTCLGHGKVKTKCIYCKGTQRRQCSECNGTGKCTVCKGSGKKPTTFIWEFSIEQSITSR